MKAYVTSRGEPTIQLARWALERNGFDVLVVQDQTTLQQKLKFIYTVAQDDFVRIDGDVIVNRNFTPEVLNWLPEANKDIWWWQFIVFDLLKMDTTHSIGYIRKEALPALRDNIDRFDRSSRPETEVSRIKEFHDPRRFQTWPNEIVGLHGYKTDVDRSKELKSIRNQQSQYDFDLFERFSAL